MSRRTSDSLWLLRVGTALFALLVLLEERAAADYDLPSWSAMIEGSFGTCARLDTDLGGSVPCGDGAVGIDWRPLDILHLTLDLGFGATARNAIDVYGTGDPVASGGAYTFARVFVGIDVTRRFVVRPGFEAQHMFSPQEPAYHGVLELASRLSGSYDVELGMRGFGGSDGVHDTTSRSLAIYGGQLVLRWVPKILQ